MEKNKLEVCIVAKNQICVDTVASFMNLNSCDILREKYDIYQKICSKQSDLPKARSLSLTEWYENSKEGDIFMFLDSDQSFTNEDILKSLDYLKKYDVVCGAYARSGGTLTLEPKGIISFYKDKEGELWYGSTGFMMISYSIVKKIVEKLKEKIDITNTDKAYQFFYERVVNEQEVGKYKLWLSEDYSFCWLVRQCGGVVYGYISPTIGHILSETVYPKIPVGKKWNEKSVVIYCSKTIEAWCPDSLENGIGGSEMAIIKLSQEWKNKGYQVVVYCHCSKPGNYNGIEYRREDEFNIHDTYDVIIVWRNPGFLNYLDIKGRVKILDLHDVVLPGEITENVIKNIDYICVKSEYHKSLINKDCKNKIIVIPNGGSIIDKEELKKDKNYVIYTSSYDRGLEHMLTWGWPLIKKECPDAYLNIFYGWEGFDRLNAIKGETKENRDFKSKMVELMKQEGVKDMGRVSHKKIIEEKKKAFIHYYIGFFQETDCISVRESASLDVIPVVSEKVTVFNEKKYCVKIEGDPMTKECQEKASEKIISILKGNENIILDKEKVLEETWENVAKKWLMLFE